MMDYTVVNCTLQRKHYRNFGYSTWRDWLRSYEIQTLFKDFKAKEFSNALELGCGRGIQSPYILHFTEKLISSDYDISRVEFPEESKVEFMSLDAENLSRFADREFDLIYSSNLLEHLPHIDKALKGFYRVLNPDGIMIHSVPNNTWKIFNLLLFYPTLVCQSPRMLSKIIKRSFGRKKKSAPSSNTEQLSYSTRQLDDNLQKIKKGLLQHFTPSPHGFSRGHFKEMLLWREKVWLRLFDENGFMVTKIVRLPFYFGYGYRFRPIHYLGNIASLSSSTGYIMQKRL